MPSLESLPLFLLKCVFLCSLLASTKVVVSAITTTKSPDDSFISTIGGNSILLLGDSLTRGLYVSNENLGHHPYAIELGRKMNNTSIKLLNHGINGDLTSGMMRRLSKIISHNKSIKLAVILGGTNDLGYKEDLSIVLSNLISMHQVVHNNGAYSLAIAIPQLNPGVEDQNGRFTINKGLQAYAERCSHLVHYRDFKEVFDQTVPNNLKFWSDDQLHFSALGYDEMGRLLYEDIVNFMHRLSLRSAEQVEKDKQTIC